MRQLALFLCSFLFLTSCFAQSPGKEKIITSGKTKLDFAEIPTVWIADSTKKADTLSFKTITEKDFLNFQATQKRKIQADTTIKPDSSGLFIVRTKRSYYELIGGGDYSSSYSYAGYIPAIRSHVIYHCGECACSSYLLDNEADVKMNLPCAYDAGPMGLLISPSNKRMLIYSSYDGSDYGNYYDFRSEFFIYQIGKGGGIEGLQLYRDFGTGDWSIEEIVWINDDSIALKVYEGERRGDGIQGEYKYLKTTIK
jgi:hypothetical protein